MIMWMLRKHTILIYILFMTLALAAVLQIIMVESTEPIVNLAIEGTSLQDSTFHYYIVRYLSFIVLLILIMFINQQIKIQISMICEKELYHEGLEYLTQKKLIEIDRYGTGNLLSIFTNDIREIKNFYQIAFSDLLFQPMIFFLACITILRKSPILTLVLIPLISLTFTLNYFIGKKLSHLAREVLDSRAMQMEKQKSFLTHIEAIQLSSAEDYAINQHKQVNFEVYKCNQKFSRKKSQNYTISLINEYLPIVLTICIGSYLLYNSDINYGQFMVIIQLLSSICLPISKYINTINSFKTAKSAWMHLMEAWHLKDDTNILNSNFSEFSELKSNEIIRFEEVSFSHIEENENNILYDINLNIDKGEKLCIVGASGSGKSTLIKLLMGFHDNYEGRIYIYGKELNTICKNNYWENISYVDQRSYVWGGSLQENITAGNSINSERLYKAMYYAGISDLLDDIEITLKQNGNNLSGGQKEKIGVARALYRQGEIFILDEPTSAMDKESEKQLLEYLLTQKDITVITVSHRLDTIRLFPRIIALQDGRIVHDGSFSSYYKEKTGIGVGNEN